MDSATDGGKVELSQFDLSELKSLKADTVTSILAWG